MLLTSSLEGNESAALCESTFHIKRFFECQIFCDEWGIPMEIYEPLSKGVIIKGKHVKLRIVGEIFYFKGDT